MDYYWGFNGRVKKHKETRISYTNKKSVELQYMIFEKSNKDENEKKS